MFRQFYQLQKCACANFLNASFWRSPLTLKNTSKEKRRGSSNELASPARGSRLTDTQAKETTQNLFFPFFSVEPLDGGDARVSLRVLHPILLKLVASFRGPRFHPYPSTPVDWPGRSRELETKRDGCATQFVGLWFIVQHWRCHSGLLKKLSHELTYSKRPILAISLWTRALRAEEINAKLSFSNLRSSG